MVAAAGALFAIVAWGALSDPKSRLGSWVQEKKADALFYGCGDALIQFGFLLILWGGSYSIYIGVAAFLCWVLLLVLFFRRGLKRDIETLDDPNDNPRANRLIGKHRESRGHMAIRTRADRSSLGHDRRWRQVLEWPMSPSGT
jgi:hypothetical protein